MATSAEPQPKRVRKSKKKIVNRSHMFSSIAEVVLIALIIVLALVFASTAGFVGMKAERWIRQEFSAQDSKIDALGGKMDADHAETMVAIADLKKNCPGPCQQKPPAVTRRVRKPVAPVALAPTATQVPCLLDTKTGKVTVATELPAAVVQSVNLPVAQVLVKRCFNRPKKYFWFKRVEVACDAQRKCDNCGNQR